MYKLIAVILTLVLGVVLIHSTLIIFLLVFHGIFTLELYDSYGDGWNGASLDLIINGSLFQNVTLANETALKYSHFLRILMMLLI